MSKRTTTAYWEEKRNRWRIDVQKNGIRKTFYSSTPGRTGMRECHAKADAWLDDGIINSRKKVKDMAKLYMEDLKLTTSQSHWRQYQNYIDNYIVRYIGNVPMDELSEQHFQTVLNKAYGKGLAKKTLLNLRACEMNFLKFCRKSKTTTLFSEGLRIPKGAQGSTKNILQPDDLRKFMTTDTTIIRGKTIQEHFIYAWRFAVLTGLRPGETLGLMRKDIKDGVVHVQRAYNFYGEFTRGKNENADRVFRLTPSAVGILEKQTDYLASIGIVSPYVFPDISGEPAREQTYAKHLSRYCEVNGIGKITPYELRHTFVSVAKSLDPGSIKTLVGHSASMDTLGVYGHELDGELGTIAGNLEKIFSELLASNE